MRLALTLLLALSGCASANPPAMSGPCRSDALGRFVGQQASAQLGAEMLRASGARVIRWVPFGGMVTMDFSPVRLTVHLDGANRVQSAHCG
jgi:hypothetical protein